MSNQFSRTGEYYPARGGAGGILRARYWMGMQREADPEGTAFLAVTEDRVYLQPLDLIRTTQTLDALAYINSVVAGNSVKAVLYGPGTPNTDLPDGASILAQTIYQVVVQGMNEISLIANYQYVVSADLAIVPAWVGIMFNGVGSRLFTTSTLTTCPSSPRFYEAAVADTFDNPCPVTAISREWTEVSARIASIP